MKFAVEVAHYCLFTTNYVVEAEDMDEARREVEDKFDDWEFINEAEGHSIYAPCDEEYMIADVVEVDDDLMAGTFFNE